MEMEILQIIVGDILVLARFIKRNIHISELAKMQNSLSLSHSLSLSNAVDPSPI